MNAARPKRLNRIFVPLAQHPGQCIDLPEETMHHLSRVLRILDGGEVLAWNGQGSEFVAQVHYISKRESQLKLTEGPRQLAQSELTQAVLIGQGLPEGDKMDWILEKCTEMGAAGFFPIQAQRSVVRLKGDRAEKRQAHWARVLQSAACQSERARVPELHPPQDLPSTLQHFKKLHPQGQVLLFTPGVKQTLAQWVGTYDTAQPSALLVLVGPEGGWAPEEIDCAQALGAVALQFSHRILRTETFALACLSQLVGTLALEPSATSS